MMAERRPVPSSDPIYETGEDSSNSPPETKKPKIVEKSKSSSSTEEVEIALEATETLSASSPSRSSRASSVETTVGGGGELLASSSSKVSEQDPGQSTSGTARDAPMSGSSRQVSLTSFLKDLKASDTVDLEQSTRDLSRKIMGKIGNPGTAANSMTGSAYQELALIGDGAFGTVYKATEVASGQVVAMKKIRVPRTEDGLPSSTLREIAGLKQLDRFDHPHIVRIFFLSVLKLT